MAPGAVRRCGVEQPHDRYLFAAAMRRRLAKLLLMTLVFPAAVRTADLIADRLEAERGPSTATRLLRRGSSLGGRLVRR